MSMENAVQRAVDEEKGLSLTIYIDQDPSNPREEFDNLTKMYCYHPRYNLGDKRFKSADAVREAIKDCGELALVKTLTMYDHSGITISTDGSQFPDQRWDCSVIGYVFVTMEDALEEFGENVVTPGVDVGTRILTKEARKKIDEVLEAETDLYDTYLRGDVYGYVFEKTHRCECCGQKVEETDEGDSCWGFYGSDTKKNGMEESWSDEVKALAKNLERIR